MPPKKPNKKSTKGKTTSKPSKKKVQAKKKSTPKKHKKPSVQKAARTRLTAKKTAATKGSTYTHGGDYTNSPLLRLIDSRNATLLISVLLFAFTFLSTLRFPNIWSATQFLWNYDFGVIRRGLVGEIYQTLFLGDGKMEYITFVYISFTLFVIEMGLIFYLLWRAMGYITKGKLYLSHWFFSLALAFHVHVIGYMDHLLFIFVLIIILLPFTSKLRHGLPLVILSTAGMFVHEVFIFLCAPVIALKAFYIGLSEKLTFDKAISRLGWATCALLCLIISAVFLTMGPFAENGIKNQMLLQEHVIKHANFQIRYDAVVLLERKAPLVWELMKGELNTHIYTDLFSPIIIATLPSILFYIILAGIVCFQLFKGRAAWLLLGAFSSLAIMPIAITRLASDFSRWFSMSATISFLLLLCLITLARKEVNFKNVYVLVPLWLIACGISIFYDIPLMDGYRVLKFPFIEHWEYLQDVKRGLNTFPPALHR